MCVFPISLDAANIDVGATIELWHQLHTGEHLLGYQNRLLPRGSDGGSSPAELTTGQHQLRSSRLVPVAAGGLPVGLSTGLPPAKGNDGANFMVLPLPAIPGTMGPHSFLDTSKTPSILKDMVAALHRSVLSRGDLPRGIVPYRAFLQIIEYGPWTLVVGHKVTEAALLQALAQVPERKRPDLTDEIMQVLLAFPPLYPGWTLIYAFFNMYDLPRDGEMQPFLCRYQPLEPDRAFIPTIDAHTGLPPVPGVPVEVDHTIIYGVPANAPKGALVQYTEDEEIFDNGLVRVLPRRVIGFEARGIRLPNGDFSGRTKNMATGEVTISRTNSGVTFTAAGQIAA